MNQKGQGPLEWTFFIGGCILIATIVIALLVGINPPETESWQEEWECTKWQDTGKLINCHEFPKKEIKFVDEDYTCLVLGIEWEYTGFTICLDGNYDTHCEHECKREWQEIVCEHEQKCVEQKPRKCLITKDKYLGLASGWTTTRQCDEEE